MKEEKILGFEAPIYFEYSYTAGRATSRFLRAIKKGKIMGQRCPKCLGVYVPPRGSCPIDGVATEEEIEIPDIGTVESFTINYLPIPGGAVEPPYVSANIILDGADISSLDAKNKRTNKTITGIRALIKKLKIPEIGLCLVFNLNCI